MIFLYFFLLIILLVLVVLGIISLVMTMIGWAKTSVPYLPVPRAMVPAIIDALQLHPHAVVYDLGCGDSGVLRKILASEHTARGVGIELSPLPYTIAKVWNFFRPEPRMTLLNDNFYDIPVHDATHVFLYLFSDTMGRLLPKLTTELEPGSRVVSCDFQFKEKMASKIIPIQTTKTRVHKLYVYEF